MFLFRKRDTVLCFWGWVYRCLSPLNNIYVIRGSATSFLLVTVTKLAEKYRAAERYNDFVPSAIFAKQHKHQSHNLVSSSCVTLTKKNTSEGLLAIPISQLTQIRPLLIIHPIKHRSRSHLSTFVLHKSSSSRLMG